MEELVLKLELKDYTHPRILKIYKYDTEYSLVDKSRIKKCYNSGRKVDVEYQEETFIFESDIGKGKKERIIICKRKK